MNSWQIALLNLKTLPAAPPPGAKKCQRDGCGNYFDFMPSHPHKRFCCKQCGKDARGK